MRRTALTFLFSISVLLIAGTTHAIPIIRLQMESEPGEWVGQGLNYDLVYDSDSTYLLSDAYLGSPPYFSAFSLSTVFVPPGMPNFFMSFATGEEGGPLVPGHYSTSQINPTGGPPRLQIGFGGRSPLGIQTNISGSFTVREIAWGPLRRLSNLDLDFVQYSLGSPAALRGRLEYRESGLTIIPEPSTGILLLLGLAGIAHLCRHD